VLTILQVLILLCSTTATVAYNFYKLSYHSFANRPSISPLLMLKFNIILVLVVGVHKPYFASSLTHLIYCFLWPQHLHTQNAECDMLTQLGILFKDNNKF
jgi:hypothetical protein